MEGRGDKQVVTREAKLERALKAALRLRKAIRSFDDPPEMLMWLVPVAEVKQFDSIMEELKR